MHPSNQRCCWLVQSWVFTKICEWIGPAYSCKPFGTSVRCVKGMVAFTLFSYPATTCYYAITMHFKRKVIVFSSSSSRFLLNLLTIKSRTTLWKALWQTRLDVIAWFIPELPQCTMAAHPPLSTLADAAVASSGTCHCYPEWHNFPVICRAVLCNAHHAQKVVKNKTIC